MKPLFRLYGKEDALAWHENMDPSTHNFDLDNRTQVYHFFAKAFNLPVFDEDTSAWSEVKSYDELAVGLPSSNLTIAGLAKQIAARFSRPPIPADASARDSWAADQRSKLRKVVRFEPVEIADNWTVAITKSKGVESFSHLFRMANSLSANGVLVHAIDGPAKSAATIVLDDRGKSSAAQAVCDRVDRGERVLALDLIFTGDAWHKSDERPAYTPTAPALYEQYLNTLGERPLGVESAQLIAIAHWLRSQPGVNHVRVESTGIRNQVVTLIAAALEPQIFSDVVIHEGMKSLGYLVDKPVEYSSAPDLFCLDLYKDFDLDQIKAMAGSTNVKTEHYVEDMAKP
jgi:hypothetical protein